MIIRRPEMRYKLASLLAKMMNLPAPLHDGEQSTSTIEPESNEA